MHAIEELAEFAANHPEGSLPGSAIESCSLLLTDLIGAVAAGFNSELANAARAAAHDIYGLGPVSIWLTGSQLSIAGAAMANSSAACALDIDDGHRGAAGHPGAGIIPAVLAIAQALGSSDEQVFEAIAIGYDVGLRIATARPTATIETFFSCRWVNYGVAAAAGRLLNLSAPQIANAMAIAGAEGPIVYRKGTSRYQGSSVKEAIPAAVVAGLTGAFRARAGATGPIDLLDREEFFKRSTLTRDLGKHWWMEDCYLKPYACCRYMHAAIDAIEEMRHPDAPIVSLRVDTFQRGTELTNKRTPDTLEDAQYSYYFCCALTAIHGAEALQPIDPVKLRDPKVLELANRIELTAHADFADTFPKNTPCRVILDQGQGPKTRTVEYPLGDVANPMSRDQVKAKFQRIALGSVDLAWQQDLLSAIDGSTSDGFAPLFAALIGR